MEISVKPGLIDLFFLILCLRVIYISVSRGICLEALKLSGLLVSSLLAFQYYPPLAGNISRKLPFFNQEYFYFWSFLAIFLSVSAVFSLVRLIMLVFLEKKEKSFGEKLIALFAGGLRAAFLASLVIFLLHLTPLGSQRFSSNLSYRIFKNIAPKTYLISFAFINKLNSGISLNEEIQKYYEDGKI